MARVNHTAVKTPGSTNYTGTAITWVAATISGDPLKEMVTLTGKQLLLAKNTHATVAKTVTVTSVNDAFGRTTDVAAVSIAALAYRIFGPFDLAGWKQSADGKLYFEGESTDIEFVVLTLP